MGQNYRKDKSHEAQDIMEQTEEKDGKNLQLEIGGGLIDQTDRKFLIDIESGGAEKLTKEKIDETLVENKPKIGQEKKVVNEHKMKSLGSLLRILPKSPNHEDS